MEMDLLSRPNSISGFMNYTVIEHMISHVACFIFFLIVSKMASSSLLKATFGNQQGQTLQVYVETLV